MDKNNFDWRSHLIDCMKSTDYCCLATVDSSGVWSNPVYFAWDENFNLYFISQMHSRHMQNLKQDHRVALSIYKTEQKGDVLGVQLEGEASILMDQKEDIKQAFTVYYARAGQGPDMQSYLHDPTWIFVKIIPSNIYYFDTRFFGEKRQTVPREKL